MTNVGALCLTAVAASAAIGSALRVLQEPKHFWPHARGPIPGQYGVSTWASQVSKRSLVWSWHHPQGRFHTVLAGGPVIDSEKNLYLSANDGVRKFSPNGTVLWHYPPRGSLNNEPALMGGLVYGSTEKGYAFAVNMTTGQEVWANRLAEDAGMDCGYPAAHDGIFVVSAQKGHDRRMAGGNLRVFGLHGATGQRVWEFRLDVPVWNFSPLFPGDGTTTFMDFEGGMYSLKLHSGELLWHMPAEDSNQSFSDGGATLGPNKAVYSCSNPGRGRGIEGSKGVIRAFRLSDGHKLWERLLPQPCNSYPAVGRLAGQETLSVVVTPGSFPGSPAIHGSVMAFDAATGQLQWQYQAPVFRNLFGMAKGDIEGAGERKVFDPDHLICLPAQWSAATIDTRGEVFAGRMDGLFYTVRGPPANRTRNSGNTLAEMLSVDSATTTPGVEVETFTAEAGFLHGAAAWAPGMLATASCDTLFVFNY